jgi:hypothetical protein
MVVYSGEIGVQIAGFDGDGVMGTQMELFAMVDQRHEAMGLDVRGVRDDPFLQDPVDMQRLHLID